MSARRTRLVLLPGLLNDEELWRRQIESLAGFGRRRDDRCKIVFQHS